MDEQHHEKSSKHIDDECSIFYTIKLLGKKWILYILSELMVTPRMSFSELKNRLIGTYDETISARVLSDCLKDLEHEEIVHRQETRDRKPIRVHYSLTQKGQDLTHIFAIIKTWGVKWGGVKHKKCRTLTCIHNAIPLLDFNQSKELFDTELIS
ncbi:MAG: winged helix-turn-helix transcriptional regulator [Candidatus Kariarchaeaceae archaeon]|jgi:DNA-binding HxlR family transcriptional regulator